jgi:hypothetical protein
MTTNVWVEQVCICLHSKYNNQCQPYLNVLMRRSRVRKKLELISDGSESARNKSKRGYGWV